MCQTRGTKSLQRATGIDRDSKTQNSTRQQLLNIWDFEERKLNGTEKRDEIQYTNPSQDLSTKA